MSRIRSKGTKPELIFARHLRKNKIYFTQNDNRIFGSPDFVFRKKRIVVFIDSDFWHVNPKKFAMPKTNEEYWIKKLERNMLRDKKVNKHLRNDGWRVLRFWESQIYYRFSNCFNRFLKSYEKQGE